MSSEKSESHYWLLIFVLAVLLWLFVTTGGRQIFVNEMLGEAYDSQAEHFLRGDLNVDVEAIRHESIIVDGKVRMYFGPFPALVRIPLNFIHPAGRGKWSRISGFCAAMIALAAFAGLLRQALRASSLPMRKRHLLGHVSLVGFAFASPLLLLLGNLSIYNEAIIWGLAWSLAALFFALRSRAVSGRSLTGALLGFSLCAIAALFSRVTFGLPLLLIAPLLAFPLLREKRFLRLTLFLAPLALGAAAYLALSYAKFGTFTGINYQDYVNPLHRDFAHRHGTFDLRRIPLSFADYFGVRFPPLQNQPPFLVANRHPYNHPSEYSLSFSETYLPVTLGSSWLVCGALFGLACLFRRDRSDLFERWIALALLAQVLCILSYFALAQRYAADLYPFLIFLFLVFLRAGGSTLLRLRYVLIALVAFSIVINSLTTISWLVDADQNVPNESRASWKTFLHRLAPADGK